MWLFILATTGLVTQQGDPLTQFLSGVAAIGGMAGAIGGISSAVYVARFTRRKQERDFLASKLETLFSELSEEITQTSKAVEIVLKGLAELSELPEIFAENEAVFRPIWTETNSGEMLTSKEAAGASTRSSTRTDSQNNQETTAAMT
jgi:hypothetical protein